MKRTLTTTLALLFVVATFAQGVDDACLFSQTYYQGTAKALGMGNAMGAVGGDMTSVCINPAGMGIYRSTEFTTTLSLMDNYISSSYYGTTNGDNRMRLSIPNLAKEQLQAFALHPVWHWPHPHQRLQHEYL